VTSTVVRLSVDPTTQPITADHPMRLHAWMALSLTPLLAQTVDDPAARSVLVADAVACWLALPRSVRTHYQTAARGDLSPLELFGWDYHHQADQLVTASRPDPTQIPAEADEEEVIRAGWQTLIRIMRHRLDADLAPPSDWLARFPGPATTLFPGQGRVGINGDQPPTVDGPDGGLG
jgi:hypothetical protein